MFVTILTSLIFPNLRRALKDTPEEASKWNEWELRVGVVLSLCLQVILILIGNRRKHSTSNILRAVLWLAYLAADAVATHSLDVLSNDHKAGCVHPSNFVISAFWAPFLLLHLGGPDTITAYSLEDNELWTRHLLGLVVQVSVALYVFFRALSERVLNFLAIPMFVVGFVKFGERIWVLRSMSSVHFRGSLLHDPDPGPNYAKYMEQYVSKRSEGFKVDLGKFVEARTVTDHPHEATGNERNQIAVNVSQAHKFFETFRRLCADLILSFHDVLDSQYFFRNTESEQAFEVIDFELGFMYDTFYTKADLIYSRIGGILRCITLSLTIIVLVAFPFTTKPKYKVVDLVITYMLLGGAVVLEMYAIVIMLSSDWTMLWMSKHKFTVQVRRAVSLIPSVKNKRWSNTVAQYNLIIFCLKARPQKFIVIQKVSCIDQLLGYYRYKDSNDVSEELKTLIFEQLKEKSTKASNSDAYKKLCARRGDQVLEKAGCLAKLGWSINGVEFDQSILLWHIATDLCYHSDMNRNLDPGSNPNCKASKILSNYMLYLLVMCPFMLPNGIGQIRFRDTCAEAEEFFKNKNLLKSDAKRACTKLFNVSTDFLPLKVKGDRSKSVLFDACRLAKALQSLESERRWEDNMKKWEIISHVWVEMLSYAANQCRWKDHGQQLRRGGELLTHVWLLMAHLGLTEQFQISEGQARPKLIARFLFAP
ncbi:unnamed protein product [Malus baccata var. baccata]